MCILLQINWHKYLLRITESNATDNLIGNPISCAADQGYLCFTSAGVSRCLEVKLKFLFACLVGSDPVKCNSEGRPLYMV